MLREYVQVRLSILQRTPSSKELDDAIARSNEIQEALWQQTQAVAAKYPGLIPTGIFIQTLNEMINDAGTVQRISRPFDASAAAAVA